MNATRNNGRRRMASRLLAGIVMVTGPIGGVVGAGLAGGGLLTASASGSVATSSFVPITPCRLMDTRAGEVVGPRATPLEESAVYTVPVWGSNGNCTIPTGATGLSMNVVAINPTAASYLTIFPADQPLPLASSLNWVAGQAPTPNAVTVAVSADGQISFYNNGGTVDLAADIVGYYEPSGTGGSGAQGPPGPQGATGAQGEPGAPGAPGSDAPKPAQVVWVAKSGGDYTTVNAALASITDNTGSKPYLIRIGPGTYTETRVELKDYVDIEGSGQETTTITCACGTSSITSSSATMRAVGLGLHSEVRDLSVVNTGGGGFSMAISTDSVTSHVSFDDVTANASGGALDNFAFFNYGTPAAPLLTNVTAIATGGSGAAIGVYNSISAAILTNLKSFATGSSSLNVGVYVSGSSSTVLIRDSHIRGTANSVWVSTGRVHIANSVLDGPAVGVGAANCIGAVTPALTPFTCA